MTIPELDLTLYSRCLVCRMNADGTFASLEKEDFEKFRQGLDNALSFIETGIVPPPVVVEESYHDDADRKLEEIDFKF